MPFQVWTDHKNLEYLHTAKRLNSRQAQWALFFARFRQGIRHPEPRPEQAAARLQSSEGMLNMKYSAGEWTEGPRV